MAKKKTDVTRKKDIGAGKSPGKQPPPPEVDASTLEEKALPDSGKAKGSGGKKFIEFDAAEAIYSQLVMTKKALEELVGETKEAKVKKQLNLMPVSVSDLMKGFQGAVSKANRAVLSGEEVGEDIERMAIKNLEIAIDAPIIGQSHNEDPKIMLPNENSSDSGQAKVTLKFSVVSVPKTQRK